MPASNPRAFLIAYAERARLDRAAATASATLNAIPGIGSGRMGLTPDSVKASPQYRAAYRAYQRAAADLRNHVGPMLKRFPREIRAAREYQRNAKLRSLNGETGA